MRRPSPLVLGFVASLSASIAALSPLVPSARGDLDRIAADGVTERGGSAEYARMLPRTGADGRLDASLLPPVADWASQPISNLYYAAGNSPVQGNGSPQYPFRTLTYALSHMLPGSALLLAPATYSGTLALQSGQAVTLVGLGPSSYVSSLSVTASGSSSGTRLALVGLRVGTLSLAGGTVDVRLSHSTVAQLTGSASAATVTRTDLGSLVGFSTLRHADVYAGYDTVPHANALRTPDGTASLALAGGRAIVDSGGTEHAVAYLSDVAAATNNGLHAAVEELRAADTAIVERISAEAATRQDKDVALSNRITTVASELSLQIAGVWTSWGGQLSTLSRAVDNLRADVDSLHLIDTNEIIALQRSIAHVQTSYQAADTLLRNNLNSLSATVNSLSSGLAATIDGRVTNATMRIITARQPTIVSNATAAVDAKIGDVRSALSTQIATRCDALDLQIADIQSELSRLGTVEAALNTLIRQLASANNGSSFTNAYHITLPPPLW